MALARCGIVGVARLSVIWGRNLRCGLVTAHTGTGKHYWLRVRVGSWNSQPTLCAHF